MDFRNQHINKRNKYTLRDTLFGDMPISAWNGNNSSEEPWVSFQEVEKYLKTDQTQLAIQLLKNM